MCKGTEPANDDTECEQCLVTTQKQAEVIQLARSYGYVFCSRASLKYMYM